MKSLPIFVFAIWTATAWCEEPIRLRVLSYNIHHAEGIDRKLDLERIAKVIQSVKPDLVGLQEVDRKAERSKKVDQPAELARLTKMNVAFEQNIPFQGGDYGNAILSRFPIEKHSNLHLPQVREGEQRGILSVTLKLPKSKETLTFYNTHLDHRRGDADRLASAKKINELVKKRNSIAILVGDLNTTSDSPVFEIFAKEWKATNAKEMPTVPVANPRRQIDFVLVRPASRWKLIETKVLAEEVASDHRAIFAIVELLPPAK